CSAYSETFNSKFVQGEENDLVPTGNRSNPMQDKNPGQETSTSSNDKADIHDIPLPSCSKQDQFTQQQNTGSGDEPALLRSETIQTSTMLQTFIKQANQQSESFIKQANQQNEANTRLIGECMAGTASMIKETCESMKECMMGVANMTRNNFEDILREMRELNERVVRTTSLTSASQVLTSQQPITINTRPAITAYSSTSPPAVISLVPSQANSQPTTTYSPYMATQSRMSAATTTNMANTVPSSTVASTMSNASSHNTVHSINDSTTPSLTTTTTPHSSTSLNENTCSKTQNVKLPPFTGKSSDSWKVWHARFTTVANLNQWNDVTRLSELMQRLQGTAAEFVFDEIPADILTSYDGLVSELDSRFKSVETNRTYKVQFGKRFQKYEETVEEYAAELKRIYDKAYPGRNPEMRRQLLLQQFLNGLKDKNAKFAVEYYKEPNSIEEAVHHVVTYIEAQQGPKSDTWHNRSPRAVRFDDDSDGACIHDDDYDDYAATARARSLSPFPSNRNRQILRKVKNASHSKQSNAQSVTNTPESEILQKILTLVENANNNFQTNQEGQGQSPGYQKQESSQNQKGQGHPYRQGQNADNPKQGYSQGQAQGQGQNQGQARHSTLQCYYCLNTGHIKRNCPILKAEQNRGTPSLNYRTQRPTPEGPLYRQPQFNPNNIDLN
ncbi:MAG: C2HC-type zinc finger protein, partial [Candidatus Thiodiazotropha sp.]